MARATSDCVILLRCALRVSWDLLAISSCTPMDASVAATFIPAPGLCASRTKCTLASTAIASPAFTTTANCTTSRFTALRAILLPRRRDWHVL